MELLTSDEGAGTATKPSKNTTRKTRRHSKQNKNQIHSGNSDIHGYSNNISCLKDKDNCGVGKAAMQHTAKRTLEVIPSDTSSEDISEIVCVDDNEIDCVSILHNPTESTTGGETKLPLKKRRVKHEVKYDPRKEEISYPVTPMMSIAEVEDLRQKAQVRSFNTPSERTEMPPLPAYCTVTGAPGPIITEQFNINNHTYNNPIINYPMNPMNPPHPMSLMCGPYLHLPHVTYPISQDGTRVVSEPTGTALYRLSP